MFSSSRSIPLSLTYKVDGDTRCRVVWPVTNHVSGGESDRWTIKQRRRMYILERKAFVNSVEAVHGDIGVPVSPLDIRRDVIEVLASVQTVKREVWIEIGIYMHISLYLSVCTWNARVQQFPNIPADVYRIRRQDERRRVGSGSLRVVVSTKAAVDRAAKSWPVSLSCAQTCPPMNGPYFVETWKTLLSVSGLYRYRPCHDKRGISVTCNWIENNSFFFFYSFIYGLYIDVEFERKIIF